MEQSFRQIKIAKEEAVRLLGYFRFAMAGGGTMRNFRQYAFQILHAIDSQTPVPDDALQALKSALNRKVKAVTYHPKQTGEFCVALGFGLGIAIDRVRHAAELLVRYLEVTDICGSVHTTCQLEGCTNIVVGGRGNKRFCSDQHRIEFWTYKRQRDYFQNKQRSNRKRRKALNLLKKNRGE